VKVNFSKRQNLIFNDLILLTFFDALSGVDIKKSTIFTAHVNYTDGGGRDFDFGMARGNLSIFDDD
jgi:hypothetical protein